MYPPWLTVTATCSSAIRSSRWISAASSSILVRRSSPYCFLTSSSSFTITPRSFFSEPRMDAYSAMLSRVRPSSFGIVLGCATGSVDVNFFAGKVGDQIFARFGAVGAGANDGDHVVQVIERSEVAFEDVLAVFGFGEQVRGAAADHVHTMVDEMFNGLHQTHFLGLVVGDCQ